MNTLKQPTLALTLASFSLALASSANAVVISYWDFNDGFSEADKTLQIVHTASQGNGTLYQQRADTDGNGKGGVAYAGNGITATDGKAMAWDDVGKSGDNDAEFFVSFFTTGFKDINIRMDLQGNALGGIVSYDLKYDTNTLVDVAYNGGTIKDFAGGTSTSFSNNTATGNPAAYTEISIDMSTATAINNQSVVVLRFDDLKENDDLRIDNIVITGTAIPEPSSTALLGLGGLALLLRRKK